MIEANDTHHCRCLLGSSLPLLGHAAYLNCFARREAPLHASVREILDSAEHDYLRPAATRGLSCAQSAVVRRCAMANSQPPGRSLLSLLTSGLWAAEAFLLTQRVAPAFAVDGLRPPLGGPEPPSGSDVIISFDPHESRFYGRGLPEFVTHVWGDSNVAGFRVRQALPCADVLVVRDSLPMLPFPGALVYIDHEAGIGLGRDAGRLDVVLAKYRVVYLGVLEPLAKTRCMSRSGPEMASARRICAKVFSGRGLWPLTSPSLVVPHNSAGAGSGGSHTITTTPPMLEVLHVPFASTSFANRRMHAPMDLATESRSPVEKPRFLGYLAYACVDHRELIRLTRS